MTIETKRFRWRSVQKLTMMAVLMVSILSGIGAQTQNSDAIRPRLSPILVDESGERARPLDLQTLAIDVRIVGAIARTTMSMSFFNPGERAVAGNLYFPLPVNASVSGYALDINGVLVDGVPVERDTARQVYQTVMARGTDPGIVEWTRGNVFKTRVFPVPAHGSRSIRISYLSTVLPASNANPNAHYVVALDYSKSVKDFKLSLEVVKPDAKPVITNGPWNKLEFLSWRDGFRTEFSAHDIVPNKDCVVELPQVNPSEVLIEKTPAGRTTSGNYFLWSAPLGTLQSDSTAESQGPASHITLYWDASFSRRNSANDVMLKTLELWFRSQAAAGKTSQKLDLIVFRETAEVSRGYEIKSGDAKELLRDLSKLSYDGATRLENLPKPNKASDLAILVSDGFSSLGSGGFPDPGIPFYALALPGRVDAAQLQGIANQNGGQLVIVSDPAEAARKIGQGSFRLIAAKVLEGSARDLEPFVDSTYGLAGLSGHIDSATAKISLSFGYGTRSVKEITVSLNSDDAIEADNTDARGLLGTFWAQNRLARLVSLSDAELPASKTTIRELGMEWGLVTPGTSLLVLETLAQYLEFKIAPPESLARMRSDYFAAIAQKEKDAKAAVHDHLEDVYALFQARQSWGETVFKYPADYRIAADPGARANAETGLAEALPRNEMEADRISNSDTVGATTPNPAVSQSAPGEAFDAKKKEDGSDGSTTAVADTGPSISIQAWNPDTPYLRELYATVGEDWEAATDGTTRPAPVALTTAKAEKAYQRYLDLRPGYEKSPGFFFDVGDFFAARGARLQAIRIWSVLAELDLEAPDLLRILAYRLSQTGDLELSKEVFTQVLAMRPEEPQSYRDLGLVLDKMKDYSGAVAQLWQVVKKEWPNTPEIELVALEELNAAAARAKKAGQKILPEIESRFLKLMDTDIRIVLSWDTNMSDMDIWVIEPSGEKAYYGNQNTHIGGLVSHDITTGYGPEEYMIHKAMKGTYKIQVNYYGNQNPEVSGTVTLQAEVITNFGRPNEKRQALTLSLKGQSDTYTVGEIKW